MSEMKIRTVRKKWFTVKINDNLFLDLSESRFDSRDWIISKRQGITLEQDKGFMYSYSRLGWRTSELKAELLSLAEDIKASLEDENDG